MTELLGAYAQGDLFLSEQLSQEVSSPLCMHNHNAINLISTPALEGDHYKQAPPDPFSQPTGGISFEHLKSNHLHQIYSLYWHLVLFKM